MSASAAPTVVSSKALRQRLGRHAITASRDVKAVAELAAGEQLRAVVVAVWQRRAWVVVATDTGLRLARRPRIFGRGRAYAFQWRDLTEATSGSARFMMRFGEQEVSLVAAGPHDEFVRLIETARAHHEGDRKPFVAEIRELATRKLGRVVAFGWEAAIEGLPDRLAPGERIDRVAAATLDFHGLLVLTDRRLLLLNVALRRANERMWEIPRTSILTAEPVDDGLRLLLSGHDDVTLREFVPPERRYEFAAVLYGQAV